MQKRTVIDTGSGTPLIVFVHGFCCHATDWQWHIDAFSETNRVIAPTLRGHQEDGSGPNDLTIEDLAGDVADLLVDKNITDAILVGHSLGQRVVLEIQAQVPDRVAGLVFVDGSNVSAADLNTTLNAFDSIKEIKPWAQALFEQMFLPNSFAQEQAKFRQRIADFPADRLRAIYRNLIVWDGTRFEAALEAASDTPLLVLQSTIRANDGSRRTLNPQERGPFLDLLEQGHPDCTIITYPGLSHFLTLDAPEQVKDDIEAWMAEKRFSDV